MGVRSEHKRTGLFDRSGISVVTYTVVDVDASLAVHLQDLIANTKPTIMIRHPVRNDFCNVDAGLALAWHIKTTGYAQAKSL